MIKSINELVQNLQANKQPSTSNVARLSQVYAKASNSVAKSNTGRNISTQEHIQNENKPNNFPEYQHPFHLLKMIT